MHFLKMSPSVAKIWLQNNFNLGESWSILEENGYQLAGKYSPSDARENDMLFEDILLKEWG